MLASRYDPWLNELGLVRPILQPADEAINALASNYRQQTAEARERIRDSASEREQYELISFAQRAAVFAVRENAVHWIENGLAALAITVSKQVDFRDVLTALSLLHHSAKRLGFDSDQVIRNAAMFAESGTAEVMTGYCERPAGIKGIRPMGYDEVTTSNGFGFIRWDGRRYEPTYDLKEIGIDLADSIPRDEYYVMQVTVASDLPRVWLEPHDGSSLDASLNQINAVATVFAGLRPEHGHKHGKNMVHGFLAEMESQSAAAGIFDMVSTMKPVSHATVTGIADKLFCLIVLRASWCGTESQQGQQTLERFRELLFQLLHRHTRKETHAVALHRPWW